MLHAARNLQLEGEVRELQGLLRTLRTDMGDQVERLEQVTRAVTEEGQRGGRAARGGRQTACHCPHPQFTLCSTPQPDALFSHTCDMSHLQELRLVKETSDMALADYERQRESELAELREQLWAEQQAAKALRDRLEGGRKVLEERAADVTGLKVWELECGGG